MKARTPNNVEGLSAQSTVDGEQEYLSSTDGRLNVNPSGLTPVEDFDYLEVTATSATVDTLLYKVGGAGGTTVQTIVVNYTGAGVDKISDTFDSLEYS